MKVKFFVEISSHALYLVINLGFIKKDMNIKIKTIILLFSLLLQLVVISAAEERSIELTAQGILARADQIMKFPRGLVKGNLKHVMPDGRSYSYTLSAYISKEDYLYNFSTKERGDTLKLLFNLKGEDIWVYNIHSLKLYHKLGIDRFDEVLATNFYYIDMSNAELQVSYTATLEGSSDVKGYDTYMLRLRPIFKNSEYGELVMYVSKKDFIPLRIDFYDRDRAIFKFMMITKTMEKNGRIIPVRYDMMNIKRGTISILSFHSFDEEYMMDREMFRSEKLGE